MTIHCRARYPRKTGDRIVECSLDVGHTGDHVEFGTGIDWPQRGPLPPEDERDAALTATHPDPDRLWATASALADLAGAVRFAVRHAPRTMTTVERMDYIAQAFDRYEADMERVEQASRAVV